MKHHIESNALRELYDAAFWYEEQQTGLGEKFRAAFETALQKIKADPERFGFYEFASKDEKIRRIMLSRFPYLLLYKVADDEIRVFAIAHTSRNPGYWKERGE